MDARQRKEIADQRKRDRLLETCIKEARFGNAAAIHTLITEFGYPESIRNRAVETQPEGGA